MLMLIRTFLLNLFSTTKQFTSLFTKNTLVFSSTYGKVFLEGKKNISLTKSPQKQT